MPYRRKDSPYWYISYRDAGGKKVCESAKTEEFREAKALEDARRVEARKARKWGEHPHRTFEEVVMAYLDAHQGARSAERDRYSAVRLGERFQGMAVARISGAMIRDYRQRREAQGVSPSTVRRELGFLSAACNWCRAELDWPVPNPVAGRKPPESEGRVRWITSAQAHALIHAAGTIPRAAHLAAFIRLALHTGMRRGELLGLEWSRVDMGRGMIYLGPHHQKSGRHGSVLLNREARDALIELGRYRAEHCPASPWVFCHADGRRVGSVRKAFATACRLAGLEDFHPHDLRHTFASWLAQSGAPLVEICRLMRHSDIRMTMRYAHLAPEHGREAVERLESGFNSSTLPEGRKSRG